MDFAEQGSACATDRNGSHPLCIREYVTMALCCGVGSPGPARLLVWAGSRHGPSQPVSRSLARTTIRALVLARKRLLLLLIELIGIPFAVAYLASIGALLVLAWSARSKDRERHPSPIDPGAEPSSATKQTKRP